MLLLSFPGRWDHIRSDQSLISTFHCWYVSISRSETWPRRLRDVLWEDVCAAK